MNIDSNTGCAVEVTGKNSRWYDRLHCAGLTWYPQERCWWRAGLSESQAKSLAGRMRAEGLTVLVHGLGVSRLQQERPYTPSRYDLERAEAARRTVNQSLAKAGKDVRHRNDTARKSSEPRSTSAP